MRNNWANWLIMVMKDKEPRADLVHIRNLVVEFASLKPTDHLLDIGTGLGFVGFKAYEKLREKGKIVAIDSEVGCIAECQKYIEENNIDKNYILYEMDLLDNSLPVKSFDVITSRSVIMHIKDKQKAFNKIYRLLKDNGRLSIYEPVHPRKTERFYKYLKPKKVTNFKKMRQIEDLIRNDSNDHLTNYDSKSIKSNLQYAGFSDIKIFSYPEYNYWKWIPEHIDQIYEYFTKESFPYCVPLKDKYLEYISEEEFNNYVKEIKNELLNKHFYQYAVNNYIIALKNPSIASRLNFLIMGIVYGLIFGIIAFFRRIKFYLTWWMIGCNVNNERDSGQRPDIV